MIEYDFEILKDTPDYMLIGQDLSRALGLQIVFEQGTVQWSDNIIKIDMGNDCSSRVLVKDTTEVKLTEETFA